MNFFRENDSAEEAGIKVIGIIVGVTLFAWNATRLLELFSKHQSIFCFGIVFNAVSIAAASGIIIGICITPWALRPLFSCIDSIYRPGGYSKRPPLNYQLAEQYLLTRKFDLAIGEYAKIYSYYPKEHLACAKLCALFEATGQIKSAKQLRFLARLRFRKQNWEKFISQLASDKADLLSIS